MVVLVRNVKSVCFVFWGIASSLLLCWPIAAEIYSGSGTAAVIEDNEALARQQAARMALREALLKAGSSVALLQEMEPGEIADNIFNLLPNPNITQIRVLEEYQKQDRITISLSADIWPGSGGCDGRQISKAISIIPLMMTNPEQAAWGNLQQLTAEISARLHQELHRAEADFVVKAMVDTPVTAHPERVTADTRKQLVYLADQNHSQYLVMGRITNMALGKLQGGLFSSDRLIRQFAMQLTLIDGATGLPIQIKEYQTRTEWPFGLTASVNPLADQFWRAAYGTEIARLLRDATDDISLALQCAKPKSKVIKVNETGAYIGIGARQGVRTGDRFRLMYRSDFSDQWGTHYRSVTEETAMLEAIQIYPDHSLVIPLDKSRLLNIQLKDLVQFESF